MLAFTTFAFVLSGQAADMYETVKNATSILEARQGSANPIPLSALETARGVAIVDITKGGLVVGGAGGDGVVVLRVPQSLSGESPTMGRNWGAPIPVGFAGASFGAQVGGSNTKAIVLLNTPRAVRMFTSSGKLTWNASASGTAGAETKGEQANDTLSDYDVSIYRETDGLYGGAVLGGMSVHVQEDKMKAAYGGKVYVRDLMEGKVAISDYSRRLVAMLEGKR